MFRFFVWSVNHEKYARFDFLNMFFIKFLKET